MKRIKFTKEEMNYIRENIDKLDYNEMAKTLTSWRGFTITPKQVCGKANHMGLKRVAPKNYNRDFFNEINTKEKAYWLGFIYADGWISRSKIYAELGIQLAQKDKQHLIKFCESLGHSNSEQDVVDFMAKRTTIKTTGQIIEPRPATQVRLYSVQLVDNLIEHGISLRKTYSKVSPDFIYGYENNVALLRGFYDGDGSLDKNGFIHFTAYSDVFLKKVKNFLEELGIETYRIYRESEKKCRLMVKEKSHKKFLDIIYQDNSYSYLERKYNLYNSLHKTAN